MGMFQRLAGTVAAFLQIGGAAGPGWNANAGALEAKDPTNTTFAVSRNANPVGQNDSVNLAYNPWAGPNTPPANGSWTQTDWYISPATGNNANSGALGSPLASKAELARRYGTWSPVINGITVTLHYLDADTTATDPSLFAPLNIHGGYFIQTSPLPASSFTGTLLVVTSLATATNTMWASTFTTTTGAIAAKMLLVNTTRGNSRAFAQRNKGAGVWQITQPLTPYALNSFPFPSAVNTWAAGDAIIGYALTNVNIPKQDGFISEFDAAFGNSNLIYQLNIWDAGAGSDNFTMNAQCGPYVIECSCNRVITADGPTSEWQPVLLNVACDQLVFLTGAAGNGIPIYGGFLQGGWLQGVNIQFNTIISGSATIAASTSLKATFIDNSVTVTINGNCVMANGTGCFFGPGVLTVNGTLNFSGSTAVAALPVAILQIGGVAKAYSNSTTAGVTTVHQVTLSAPNIDAAAGAAGFGGFAYAGGFHIQLGTSQP